MSKRPTLPITGTLMDVLTTMSEGNPGALTVLMALIEQGTMLAFDDILNLDDMNIRGEQIAVGFEEFADGDLYKFHEAVRRRDDEMIRIINENCLDHVAVKHGASFGSLETL